MSIDPALFAVIMAGGRGERFWPLGRRHLPKQFLPLAGERPLLADTVARLEGAVAVENILVVTNMAYVDRTRALLPQLPPENILGEPVGRNTAPCIALAAGTLRRRRMVDDAVMAVLPADHAIEPAETFRRRLAAAAAFARREAVLLTFGITPTEAATDYGYIQCGEAVGDGFYRVKAFREKPDLPTAQKFLEAGDCRWNSGIFVWSLGTVTAALRRHAPALADFAAQLAQTDDPDALIQVEFPRCPAISIDYAILEKADNVMVGDAPFVWDDLGGMAALARHMKPDAAGNFRRGDTVLTDCADCLVAGEAGRVLGVVGMKDVAIVQSGNATLVCPRAEAARVRELLAQIKDDPNFQKYL